MPLETAATLPSLEEQRAAAQSRVPANSFVTSKRTITRVNGRDVVTGMIDYSLAAGRGQAQDLSYLYSLQSMHQRHNDTNITPCTIINLLPIPLVVNSPMEALRVRIQACMKGDVFTSHTWEAPAIEVEYVGEGKNMPHDFMPKTLARAFEREYQAFGGVFMIDGYPDEKTLNSAKVQDLFDKARISMRSWKLRKVEEANGMWNTMNHVGQAGISDIHRECAQSLFEEGVLPNLPPWIQIAREQGQVQSACPQCKTIPTAGAVACQTCHYVLNPAEAFRNSVINEESLALERLTRAEVKELGVSAFVAETSDERQARLEAGLPKPKSLAQRRAEAAERGEGYINEESAKAAATPKDSKPKGTAPAKKATPAATTEVVPPTEATGAEDGPAKADDNF